MSTKKKILAAALAVCLLSIASFGTLAWFNASESVTNKFMVATTGGGTGTGGGTTDEKIFSVDLWEYIGTDDVNTDPSIDASEKDHDGITFDNVLPGVEYDKVPVVENTGSYDQYVRVVVTLTNATKWAQVLNRYGITDLDSIFLGFNNKWMRAEIISDDKNDTDVTNDELSYVYYLNEKLGPAAKEVLFTDVKMPEQLTQADMAELADASGNIQFDLEIRADAIQTEGLGDAVENAATAFEAAKLAYDKVGWPAGRDSI